MIAANFGDFLVQVVSVSLDLSKFAMYAVYNCQTKWELFN